MPRKVDRGSISLLLMVKIKYNINKNTEEC